MTTPLRKFAILSIILSCWTKSVSSCNYSSDTINCTSLGLSYVPHNHFADTIHVLVLTENKLQFLNNSCFHEYPQLTNLFLNNNEIQTVDKAAFHDLNHLLILDLSKNKISTFHSVTFIKNVHLKTVFLSGNPLQLQTSLIVSSSLTTLRLRECNISKISDQFLSGLWALETLDLSSNLLQDVDVNFGKLKHVYLQRNPWRCNGTVQELYTKRRSLIVDYKKIRCVTPVGGVNPTTWRTKEVTPTSTWEVKVPSTFPSSDEELEPRFSSNEEIPVTPTIHQETDATATKIAISSWKDFVSIVHLYFIVIAVIAVISILVVVIVLKKYRVETPCTKQIQNRESSLHSLDIYGHTYETIQERP